MSGRRPLVAVLAGAVVAAGAGSCRGARELDRATVAETLAAPDGLPPSKPKVPIGYNRELGDCRYLIEVRHTFPRVRPEFCGELRFWQSSRGGGRVLAELPEALPRRIVQLSPIERPSADARIVRFTYVWDTRTLEDDVLSCFVWDVPSAGLARFRRVGRRWQLVGTEDIVYETQEMGCPDYHLPLPLDPPADP